MDQREKILRVKKKLAITFVIFLMIGFALAGTGLYKAVSFRRLQDKEAVKLSELISNGNAAEGQYVQFDIDEFPEPMMPIPKGDSRFYYVTDMTGHTCIALISDKTLKSMKINSQTGKLSEPHQIKGVLYPDDEQVKGLGLANGGRSFDDSDTKGFSDDLGDFYVKEHYAGTRMVDLTKCLVFGGLLFLILAFLYMLPVMIKVNKGNFGNYDEKKMMQSLGKYIPEGETLAAGIHGIGIESRIRQIFGKCIHDNFERLIPDTNGTAVQVRKEKVAKYEVFVGITQHYLILSECEKYKHYYEVDEVSDSVGDICPIDKEILFEDIGTCFLLEEIKDCEMKNTARGTRCSITMKNGSFIKIMLPKKCGLEGAGMPHYEEYRRKILARLAACGVS